MVWRGLAGMAMPKYKEVLPWLHKNPGSGGSAAHWISTAVTCKESEAKGESIPLKMIWETICIFLLCWRFSFLLRIWPSATPSNSCAKRGRGRITTRPFGYAAAETHTETHTEAVKTHTGHSNKPQQETTGKPANTLRFNGYKLQATTRRDKKN